MTWFTTIDHRGEEVEIGSMNDMNAVVDAFEARLDQLAQLLEDMDREVRVRAVEEFSAMRARRDRIAADVGKAEARAKVDSEDENHRALAHAIRMRSRS